ncbi:MAG: FliH/SctL family protein [Selenomonadaceae bacterium]
MSRIIKASVWDEAPRIVEVPAPEPMPSDSNDTILMNPDGTIDIESLKAELLAKLKVDEKKELHEIELERSKLDGERMSFEAEKKSFMDELDKKRKKLDDEREEFEATRDAIMADLVSKKREAEEMQDKVRSECGIMKADAEQEKQNILDDAHQQADSIRADAQKEGHEQGVGEGREQGKQEVHEEQKSIIIEANERAEKTLDDAKREAHEYVLGAEADIAKLAMYVVEKILPQHFIDVPTIILPVIREALLKVKDQPEVILRVSPADYDLALMARSELQELLEGNGTITVHSDENLKQGDSVLETPNGNVDARITTQLETIKKALMDVVK